MPSFGLQLEGFNPKPLDEIKTELEQAFRAAFGANFDVSPQSDAGQLIGIMAERYADLWALGQATYDAFNPDASTGVSLDNVAAISGSVREAATNSEVTILATGTPATLLVAGRAVSIPTVGTRFATLADGTITLATSWAALTVYAVGDIRTNASRIYIATDPGTSAGAGGPTTTGTAIVDGGVIWRYLGEGTGYVQIAAEAEETGPLEGVAFSITQIETPVSGWQSTTNLLDATPGSDVEADGVFRLRREAELRATGNAALEAIRADLLEVEDVESVTVFENVTDATDGDGLPPHSVEALVRGGDDQDIADALLATVSAGIATHGTETESATDSQGIVHTIKFTRPDEIEIYVIVNVDVDASLFPDDGDDLIEAAIVAFGDAQATGKDVVASGLEAQCFTVPGVLDAECLIGIAPAPTLRTTIAIALRELAVEDTSRISVNVTPVTP